MPMRLAGGAAVGDSVGRSLGSLANAMREGRRITADFRADLERARADLASARVGTPAFDDAAARLDAMIDTAALTDLGFDVNQAFSGQTNEQRDLIMRTAFGSTHPVGLPPRVARVEYDLWKDEVIRNLAGSDNVVGFDDLARYPEAVNAAGATYDKYLRLRNWHELNAAGKGDLALPTDEAFLSFVLTYFSDSPPTLAASADERVDRVRAELFEMFGEDAVLTGVRMLRSAELSSMLTVRNHGDLSLSRDNAFMPASLLTLIARASDRDAFATVAMRSGGDLTQFESGAERLDAMREQHPTRAIDQEIDRVMRAELDERGRLVGDRFEGREPGEHLLAVLPLDPDPVLVRLERLRAEREARDRAQREAYEQAQQAAEQERATAGITTSNAQYDAMLRATRLAAELDEGYARLLNDPGYDMNRRGVRVVAGVWNEYVRSHDPVVGSLAMSILNDTLNADHRRVRNRDPELDKQRAEFRDLLRRAVGTGDVSVDQLVPFEQIQRERIASNALAVQDALDLSVTSETARAEHESAKDDRERREDEAKDAARAQRDQEVERARRLREAQLAAREAERAAKREREEAERARLAAQEEQAKLEAERERLEKIREGVIDHLDRLLEARDLARVLDERLTLERDAKRREKGLEPVKHDDFSHAVLIAAGLYHEAGLTRNASLVSRASTAARSPRLRNDPDAERFTELMSFLRRMPRPTVEVMPVLGDIQSERIASGAMDEEDALDLSVRDRLVRPLRAVRRAESQLRRAMDQMALSRDPDQVTRSYTRARQSLDEARAALKKARAEPDPERVAPGG